jgi:hypothetical protein
MSLASGLELRIITRLYGYVIEKIIQNPSQIFYNVSGESGYDSKPVMYIIVYYYKLYTVYCVRSGLIQIYTIVTLTVFGYNYNA